MYLSVTATALLVGLINPSGVMPQATNTPVVLAQAIVPPTGANDADKPMPMVERMNRRFPQPARVGDLIGLPVLDDNDVTLGYVRKVVRSPDGKTRLIVSYSKWFGWFVSFFFPVAVPIEAVDHPRAGSLESVEMTDRRVCRSADLAAGRPPTPLPADATIRIALARN